MIIIKNKSIEKFHKFIEDYSDFDICWNFNNPEKTFGITYNNIEKRVSFKCFAYIIYVSCDGFVKHKGRIVQLCDNPVCCNPYHLHPCLDKGSKESKLFEDILSRLRNKNNKFYKDYGGRGLGLDDRWNPDIHLRGVARVNFYIDIHKLGFDETKTIDRIDNNIGYFYNNIHFVGWAEQGQNRRTTILSPEDIKFIRNNYKNVGQKLLSSDLGKMFNVHPSYILDIIKYKNWKNIE